MSQKDGTAALNLEMPPRVPRTEYSAETHWALLAAVTGTCAGGGWRWLVHKPKEPARLLVGLRPTGRKMPEANPAPTRDQALRDFHAANAVLGFRSLGARGADEPWEGTVGQPGLLRFVALGKDRIYTAAIKLDPPATQPAATSQPARRKAAPGQQSR